MNKKIIALAVGAALAGSASVASANPCAAKDTAGVSGFIDMIYNISNEANDNAGVNPDTGLGGTTGATNSTDGSFTVDAEIDFVSTMGGADVRVDLDILNDANGDLDGQVEQAFLAWGINDALTLVAGRFNNPMTADHHDAPDMSFTTHSATYNIVHSQGGSDVTGVALAGAVGPATVTLGLLNDISGADEENSIALIVNTSPMDGLDIELGYVSQSDKTMAGTTPTTAGNVVDINAAYAVNDMISVGIDYMTTDNLIDNAYVLEAAFAASDELNFGLRLDNVAFDEAGANDVSATTVYASYAAADNLAIALEIKSGDNDGTATNAAASGIDDGSLTTIELIATF